MGETRDSRTNFSLSVTIWAKRNVAKRFGIGFDVHWSPKRNARTHTREERDFETPIEPERNVPSLPRNPDSITHGK